MNKNFLILAACMIGLGLQLADAQDNEMKFAPAQPLSDSLNSEAEESLPLYSVQDSTIYFVRTLHAGNTGGPYAGQDIWYSKRRADGQWTKPKNDLPSLNDKNNNAVVGISDQGNTLYLLNVYQEKDRKAPGMSFSFYQEQQWKSPKNIDIPGLNEKQGDFYSLYVAPTEDVVIISMQAPNSLGQEDLYVSTKNSQTGEWTKPLNLGSGINTQGFEISPFLSQDKRRLYFSSNGHPGYGNADIFYAERRGSSWTSWSRPVNLGEEINSPAFDAYFSLTPEGDVFFASNREGKMTDLYTSHLYTGDQPPQQIKSDSQDSILADGKQQEQTDSRSEALLSETQALLDQMNRIKNNEPSEEDEDDSSPTDADAYRFLFALNSAEIQPDYEEELVSLADTLNANPSMKVQIVGHADDTGGKDYNLRLSIERAVSVKKYLTGRGISERRIITYGKGATQPLKEEDTEEARQQNRRVVVGFF
ncbi:MAG: OmpA family protein [Cyclobacteriaceae bacterium]